MAFSDLIIDCKNVAYNEVFMRNVGQESRARAISEAQEEAERLRAQKEQEQASAPSAETSKRTVGDAPSKYSLNTTPTIVVLSVGMAFFAFITFLMQNYVITANQHWLVFFTTSYIVFSSYFVLHYQLEKYSSSYRAVKPGKQFYVISNLLKAAMLLVYTPVGFHLLYECLVLNEWNTQEIRNMGVLYAVPDLVSMFLDDSMTRNTRVHHICVQLFNYFNIYNDYSQDNVCRLIVVYAIFSTFAYMVNLLLAGRFFNLGPSATMKLNFIALSIYFTCCALNWSWQVKSLHRLLFLVPDSNKYAIYAYSACILLVCYDDIVLMKWLYANFAKNLKIEAKKIQ